MKKIIITTIVTLTSILIALVLVFFLGIWYLTANDPCSKNVTQTINSQFDKDIMAEIVEGNCGATNPFTYDLNLKNKTKKSARRLNKRFTREPINVRFTNFDEIEFSEFINPEDDLSNKRTVVKVKFDSVTLDFSYLN